MPTPTLLDAPGPVRPGRWRRFAGVHGWRAYALPVLIVLTVVAVWLATGPAGNSPATRAATSPTVAAATTDVTTTTTTTTTVGTTATAGPAVLDASDLHPCAANTQAAEVVVSLSRQHVWMCQAGQQVYQSAATTGETDNGDATPVGTWRVQSRETDRYLTGPGYKDYVQFWVPFHGDFGFHDASWQTMPFGSPGYLTQGSHGCVHLPLAAMSWLYQWAHVGTTVVTVQA